MSGVMILSPMDIAATFVTANNAPVTGQSNLLTPSPREVMSVNYAGQTVIYLDLGSVRTFDTVYLGGLNAGPSSILYAGLAAGLGGGGTSAVQMSYPLPSAKGPRYEAVVTRPAPASSRYVSVTITPQAAPLEIGVIAVGLAWRHPYAYGPGRQLLDTSRRTDLIDGGFGVDPGVSKATFRWRFVDLSAAERDELWDLTYDRGQRRPVIVVEDGSVNPPPAASVHYGLFDRFEPWERDNAADTQWALSMTEWR